MTYIEIKQKIDEFEIKYKKTFLLIRQKDDTQTFNDVNLEFELNPENFYYAIIARPNKNVYSAFSAELQKGKFISAAEIILENCFLFGDQILKNNDDFFLPISMDINFFNAIKEMVCINDYYIDKEKLTIFIHKTDEFVKNIEKDIEKNKENYNIFKFNKPTRKDIENMNYNNVDAEGKLLYDLCIEGFRPDILMNDNIFFALMVGKDNKGTISELLMPKKISSIKKK